MKWIKASEGSKPIVPDGKERHLVNIKYKGTPDVLLYFYGTWYWSKDNVDESIKYPVHKESWSVIEWLDESPSGEQGVQDELWEEVGRIVMNGYDYSNQDAVTAELKSKYTIAKK